jgi:hypothetical protein
MFCFVPLPTSVVVPYGPICCANTGFAVFKEAVQSKVGPSFDLSWIDHPLILEFTNACGKIPEIMSAHWITHTWISGAIGESNQTPGWGHPCDCDLWMRTELTLAFRLHHDFVLTNSHLSVTIKKSYVRDIEQAYEGNFTGGGTTLLYQVTKGESMGHKATPGRMDDS